MVLAVGIVAGHALVAHWSSACRALLSFGVARGQVQCGKEEQDSQKRPCGVDADIGDQAGATRHEQLMEFVACGVENAESPAQCRNYKISARHCSCDDCGRIIR